MRFRRRKKGPSRGRIHPTALNNTPLVGLLVWIAILANRYRLTRIAITNPILEIVRQQALADAPANAHPLVERHIDAMGDAFTTIGLIDPPGVWMNQKRLLLPMSGDTEVVEAVLDYADNYIITERPRSLPLQPLAMLGVEIITTRQLLDAARQQAPDMILEAIEQHRSATEMGLELYEAFLVQQGLDHLVELCGQRRADIS